jgi:uncharacterized protein (UPF0332 family)
MIDEDTRVLVDYRLEQAAESLAEAETLRQAGHGPRSVANRAYYAMFYAALALMQVKGLATTKHSGVIALFDREFVKSGLFDQTHSKALRAAFVLRQEGDYHTFATISTEDAARTLEDGRRFVTAVRSWVQAQA